MLYDKRWDAKPSFEGFVSWLEAQSPETQYEYMPCAECAIGQYLASVGRTYRETDSGLEYWKWNRDITRPKPWTFGAALARAKALQP